MRAAEELPAYFDAMANHAALAVLADGRHGLDRTFETVEGVPLPGRLDVEGFIVIIPADFALGHKVLRSAAFSFGEIVGRPALSNVRLSPGTRTLRRGYW
jgi:hypothetical protein